MIIKFILLLSSIFFYIKSSFPETELSKIKIQINKTEIQKEELSKKLKDSIKNINKTRKALIQTTEKVRILEEERENLKQNIEILDKNQSDIEKNLILNKKEIENAVSVILFLSSNRNFSYESMRDYIITSVILSGISDKFNEEIILLNKKIIELSKIIEEKRKEKEKLDKIVEKYNKEKTTLDILLTQRNIQNETLKKQQFKIYKRLNELSKQAKNISELSQKVGGTTMFWNKRLSYRKLPSPVKGRLILEYGEKNNLGLISEGWKIRTRSESIVITPADGKISFANDFKGFGKVVIISHKNGFNTILTHLNIVNVLVGQEVLSGEPIGITKEGRTEMYIEVRQGSLTIDPDTIFKRP